MTDQRPLDRNDPQRNEVLSLARRQVKAGTFSKKDLDAWKAYLGDEAVDAIVEEFAPPKKTAKPKADAGETPPKRE